MQTVDVKIYSHTNSGKAQAARVRKCIKSNAMSRVEKRKTRSVNRPARKMA